MVRSIRSQASSSERVTSQVMYRAALSCRQIFSYMGFQSSDRAFLRIRSSVFSSISEPPKNKNAPCPCGQRAKNRGTTSGSGIPHGRPLTASDNAICCIGHTRPGLLRFYAFGPAAPGGISALLLTALHRPAALWKKIGCLLHPIHAFRYETMGILANFRHFVKSKVVYKNRYAFFTNRSLSHRRLWYNIDTTERGWGKPMPGEYSWMNRRRPRDTSRFQIAAQRSDLSGPLKFCHDR